VTRKHRPAGEKPLHWVGSSKRDLLGFPEEVVDNVGYALGVVQHGGHPTDIELIRKRLNAAKDDYEERYGEETG
jgi:phage-related protein